MKYRTNEEKVRYILEKKYKELSDITDRWLNGGNYENRAAMDAALAEVIEAEQVVREHTLTVRQKSANESYLGVF